MRRHIFHNRVNFQHVTFRILFFRDIQTLQMRLSREACFWWTQLLRPFCWAADDFLCIALVLDLDLSPRPCAKQIEPSIIWSWSRNYWSRIHHWNQINMAFWLVDIQGWCEDQKWHVCISLIASNNKWNSSVNYHCKAINYKLAIKLILWVHGSIWEHLYVLLKYIHIYSLIFFLHFVKIQHIIL